MSLLSIRGMPCLAQLEHATLSSGPVDIEYVQTTVGAETTGNDALAISLKGHHMGRLHFVHFVVGTIGGTNLAVVGIVQMDRLVAAGGQETTR